MRQRKIFLSINYSSVTIHLYFDSWKEAFDFILTLTTNFKRLMLKCIA